MWFAFFSLALILTQRAFFPPVSYTGMFDTDEEEYDYR